jgi:5-methyltetrahydropteroyltriglutamate--homocysteine methyltransferase
MKLSAHGGVLTAIVGSYPKPRYVYPRNGRSLLDSFGFALERRRQEMGSAEFSSLLDKAVLEAIKDQKDAGIDICTDGEERRGHYVLHVVNRLEGVDARNLKPISMRAGTTTQSAPRVVGKLAYKGPLLLEEFLFTKQHVKGIAKIGLPGPTTVADCVADEYYAAIGSDLRSITPTLSVTKSPH